MLAAGCASGRMLDVLPDLPRDIALMGEGEAAQTARSQKPDASSGVRQTGGALDAPLERNAEAAGARPAARILATVNNDAILEEEVEASTYQARLRAYSLPAPEQARALADLKKQALDQIIERELVLQNAIATLKARKNEKALEKLQEIAVKEFERQWLKPVRAAIGAKSDEEFKAALQAQHMSLPLMKRQWERQFMAMEYLRSRVGDSLNEVGHVQVEEYYTRHAEDFVAQDGVDWQDLYIDAARHPTREAARHFAEVLAQRVRQGENFAELAVQFDNGLSVIAGKAVNDAHGEGRKRGEIRPVEAEPILFSMHDGQAAVVEMERGFHIVKLVKRDYAGPMPFDEKLQKQIRDKLRGEIAQREMKRFVSRLRREAIIVYARDVAPQP
jgi:hypothetical protein